MCTAGQTPRTIYQFVRRFSCNLLLPGIHPGVLSSLVRSCHGVTSPKVIPLAAGHSIFKVLCLLTRIILSKKQALSRMSKTMENSLKSAYFHAYGIMV
jgi:hypothetical protein